MADNVRRRVAIALTLVLAGALLGGCAGAESPGVPTGNAVLLTAEQHALEIAQAKQRTPLPPGAGWRDLAPLDPNAGYEPHDGASMIEFQAMCAWLLEARDASTAGDGERLGRARGVILGIPGWRSFSDPELGDRDFRALIQENVDYALTGNYPKLAPFLDGPCAAPATQ